MEKQYVLHILLRVCARVYACCDRPDAWASARVVLLTQHATRMRLTVRGLSLHRIFPHYLINRAIFGKMLLSIKYVFSFSLQYLSEIFLIIRRIQRDIVIKVKTSSRKVPVILVAF